jgi:hypothetical protein
MLVELRDEAAQSRKRAENSKLHGASGEEDAKILEELLDKV